MARPLQVDARLKDFFFDRRKVQKATNGAKRRVLHGVGASTRRYARQKVLRRRKRVSRPGEAPSVHSRDRMASLKNILYGVAPDYDSVIIGPRKLNMVEQSAIDGSRQTVPQLMEFGGVITYHEKSHDGGKTWRRRDKRRNPRPWEKYRNRRVFYKPRPFMKKTFEHEAPRFPHLFKDTFGRRGAA